MKLNYSDKVKFLKGHFQNKVGTYIDENHNSYLIQVDDLIERVTVILDKYKAINIIEKI